MYVMFIVLGQISAPVTPERRLGVERNSHNNENFRLKAATTLRAYLAALAEHSPEHLHKSANSI